ncbi:hypothetical protein AAFF_G00101680 [Aldrovandia affinis]|uniref:Uncharacterized protein n=1 Tax=Aldrovandia affinis TaxID=143900 RepID=A0AAD7RUL6_9TELE|nr:hypothetical protein AAFF_G00101680 [Aldrovandia affinis]
MVQHRGKKRTNEKSLSGSVAPLGVKLINQAQAIIPAPEGEYYCYAAKKCQEDNNDYTTRYDDQSNVERYQIEHEDKDEDQRVSQASKELTFLVTPPRYPLHGGGPDRWRFMLSTIRTIQCQSGKALPTCAAPNQGLMNAAGAVCSKLLPVGAGPQVPSLFVVGADGSTAPFPSAPQSTRRSLRGRTAQSQSLGSPGAQTCGRCKRSSSVDCRWAAGARGSQVEKKDPRQEKETQLFAGGPGPLSPPPSCPSSSKAPPLFTFLFRQPAPVESKEVSLPTPVTLGLQWLLGN